MAVPYNPLVMPRQTTNWYNTPGLYINPQNQQSFNALQEVAPTFASSLRPEGMQLETQAPNVNVISSNSPQGMAGQSPDYLSGALGALGQLGGLYGMATQGVNITQPISPVYQEGVDPSYQTGEYFNQVYGIRPRGASAGEITSNTLQGAMTGAKFGGAPGAIIGAGVGLLGSIGAGELRRSKQRRQKEKAMRTAIGQQEQFNTAQEAYDRQVAAQQEYARRNDPYRRMMNLYQQ